MTRIHVFAGWIAGILSFLAYLPYWSSILYPYLPERLKKLVILLHLHHEWDNVTNPPRSTWLIWMTVSFMLLASYRAEGAASQTLGVPIAYAICGVVTFLLSLKYGVGGWDLLDRICLGLALGSGIIWWLSGSPLIALLANLGVDSAGAIRIVRGVYENPKSESRVAWSLFFAGSAFNLLATDHLTFAIAAYLIYIFIACGTIATMVLLPRLRFKRD